ncbi:Splicing regulatory glutamine/lysine-rich protein 1 [Smittium mucronatum]|uniref:Splicing regulatory glutamine/lysine-rich protein 1 n=1 Tax=Smittium mucronatum TaxID=133383 RepID=A0A1R0GW77_9FUNG|nr:Splicing regulatory glutamine/lysine-rich protein 1 [Smittium mucronatum]
MHPLGLYFLRTFFFKKFISPTGSKEAFVSFSDSESAYLSTFLTGSDLGDRKFQVTRVDSSVLTTDALSAFNTITIPGSVVSASYFANPQGHIAGPLGSEYQAGPYGVATAAATTYTIPLGNPEVIAMMASKPRKLEPIPPSIAAVIHPAILQHDPVKAEEISRTVYVGNITSQISDQELMDFFGCCGYVAYVKMAGDGQQPTRFAFIEFTTIEAAQTALAMNGTMLAGRPLKINYSKNSINKPPLPGTASITSVSYTNNPPIVNSLYSNTVSNQNPSPNTSNVVDVDEEEAMRKLKEAQKRLLMKYSSNRSNSNDINEQSESYQVEDKSSSRHKSRSRSRSHLESRGNRSRNRNRSRDRDRDRGRDRKKSRDMSKDRSREERHRGEDRSRDESYRDRDRSRDERYREREPSLERSSGRSHRLTRRESSKRSR